MPILTIRILFQNTDYVKQLKQKTLEAEQRAIKAEASEHALMFDTINERRVNLELIDLLRTNGIRFRKSAEMSKWAK